MSSGKFCSIPESVGFRYPAGIRLRPGENGDLLRHPDGKQFQRMQRLEFKSLVDRDDRRDSAGEQRLERFERRGGLAGARGVEFRFESPFREHPAERLFPVRTVPVGRVVKARDRSESADAAMPEPGQVFDREPDSLFIVRAAV